MVQVHGIVDILGMKCTENSKEAYRDLNVIASDVSSEYNRAVLTPVSWATMVAKKILNWKKDHAKPNPAEIRAKIRRLQGLLVSHETLADVGQITQDINNLEKNLSAAEAAPLTSTPLLLPVVNSEGIVVTGNELLANPSKSSAAVLEFGPPTPSKGLKNLSLGSIIDLDNEDTWRNAADDGPDS
ncbi:hypothetical protein ACHAP5_010292 [Fusarium lateritium]